MYTTTHILYITCLSGCENRYWIATSQICWLIYSCPFLCPLFALSVFFLFWIKNWNFYKIHLISFFPTFSICPSILLNKSNRIYTIYAETTDASRWYLRNITFIEMEDKWLNRLFLSIQAIANIEQINHPLHRHNNISSLFNIFSKDIWVESI